MTGYADDAPDKGTASGMADAGKGTLLAGRFPTSLSTGSMCQNLDSEVTFCSVPAPVRTCPRSPGAGRIPGEHLRSIRETSGEPQVNVRDVPGRIGCAPDTVRARCPDARMHWHPDVRMRLIRLTSDVLAHWCPGVMPASGKPWHRLPPTWSGRNRCRMAHTDTGKRRRTRKKGRENDELLLILI